MIVFRTADEVRGLLKTFSCKGQTQIGFVPTMGALHEGHVRLIERAREENDIVVCSIFVNPLQFNDKSDFVNYPRTFKHDIELLESRGCDMVFSPGAEEIYHEPPVKSYDLGYLDQIMEGRFRPGHFNGVAVVVKRLLDIVQPQKAYFGEKDYQQLAVIRKLVQIERLNVEIVPCATVREKDGLAMSSRNMRLSKEQRAKAPMVYKILQGVKTKANAFTVDRIKEWVTLEFEKEPLSKLEYFEIADAETLLPVSDIEHTKTYVACIAVRFGEVRLIDNIVIIP